MLLTQHERRAEASAALSARPWPFRLQSLLVSAARSRSMWRAGSQEYVFSRWQDASEELPPLRHDLSLTKLYLTSDYGFLDDQTQADHDEALRLFKQNVPSDVHQDFSNHVSIDGFKARTLCYVHGSAPPRWVGFCWYVLASVLLLSLPYRLWLDWQVAALNHEMFKVIGI